MEIVKGFCLLIFVLILFAVFSLYAPKGKKAMGGLANAAVAVFLVEAILFFVLGSEHALNIEFFREAGETVGKMGGVASGILVMLALGVSPVIAVAGGLAMFGFGILPGFIAGYLLSFIAFIFEKKMPHGVGDIVGVLVFASLAHLIGMYTNPFVKDVLGNLQGMISQASEQSPIIMGLLLGGIMKVICTSPLSSMALTAMLGLTGLPMGIAGIASFGGAFADGITFKRLRLGNRASYISVMLEPLTQAPIVTSNALVVFSGSFIGGSLAGLSAALFDIHNNAPGTASPISGILVSFGFNDPMTVTYAAILAIIGGIIGGYISTSIMLKLKIKINR